MIKTDIDQPKIYVNINKRLAEIFGAEKIKEFNEAHHELRHRLRHHHQAKNCIDNVLKHWIAKKCKFTSFNCRATCNCNCNKSPEIFHSNPRCNWCKKCRPNKCRNGQPPRPTLCDPPQSKCNQYVDPCHNHKPKCGGCFNYKEKCLCKTDNLVCYPRCDHPVEYHVHESHEPCSKSVFSNSLQKDLLNCLPCELQDDCHIKQLIGVVVRALL